MLNVSKRSVSFIYTTWDRFVAAREIADLYSKNDYFVDRIFHALRDFWLPPRTLLGGRTHGNRARRASPHPLRKQRFVAGPEQQGNSMLMDEGQPDDTILAAIKAEIARRGGPVTVNIPLEGQ